MILLPKHKFHHIEAYSKICSLAVSCYVQLSTRKSGERDLNYAGGTDVYDHRNCDT